MSVCYCMSQSRTAELSLWDVTNLSQPITTQTLSSSTGLVEIHHLLSVNQQVMYLLLLVGVQCCFMTRTAKCSF